MEEKINFDSREYCKGSIKPFAMGVFGSRSLTDERVKIIILEELETNNATKIITCQEPGGVSEIARAVAKEYAYPLQLHYLNYQYLRGAFEQRSKEVIKEADFFLVIHDGESKGTANELALVKKSGKPYKYVQLEKAKYDKSNGFDIVIDWTDDLTFDE